MNIIIYVLPHEIEAMDNWLKDNVRETNAPSYWIEPLKDIKTRQSLVQVIISTDEFQLLLDDSSSKSFRSFAQSVSDFENPEQTKLKL
tara:strand:+ start:152 stop:415 length:264 start_codon:yes stop_codon:yes gene_type:complete